MADWKFSDQYGTAYPALKDSILDALVFSEQNINGTAFTGTIDVAATGVVMETLGALLNMDTFEVSGTIVDQNNTLTIQIRTDDSLNSPIAQTLASEIPLFQNIVQKGWLDLQTVVTTATDAEPVDTFDLQVELMLGQVPVQVTAQIPIGSGIMIIQAEPMVGIDLDDLNVVLTSSQGNWQSEYPEPYKSATLMLRCIAIDVFVGVNPRKIAVSAVTVTIGLMDFPIYPEKLYFNPLEVWVTVSPSADPVVSYGLDGTLALCNYQNPGQPDQADFEFDFEMDLTEFTITGALENPSDKPVNTMLQDLLGSGTDIGLSPTLTIDTFDFNAEADKTSGTISGFGFDIVMSGGFGLLTQIELEEVSISLKYSAGA